MADNYYVVSQVPDIQVLSQTQVIDVVVVGFATIPHNVRATLPVTKGMWANHQASLSIDPIAAGIESWVSSANVLGAAGVEDVDASGLIEYFVDFTVGITPQSAQPLGPMTAEVRIPIYAFGESALTKALIADPIQAAIDALNATAAL